MNLPAACAGLDGARPFVRIDPPVIWEDKCEGSKLILNTCNPGDPCLDEPLATAFPGERNRRDLKPGLHYSVRKIRLERAPRIPCGLVSYPSQAESAAKRKSTN